MTITLPSWVRPSSTTSATPNTNTLAAGIARAGNLHVNDGPFSSVINGSSLGMHSKSARSYSASEYQDTIPSIEDAFHRRKMITMRLHMPEGADLALDHLSTALGDDVVFVFVVQNNKPVVLEDEKGLFPSDVLVTQLRLLSK